MSELMTAQDEETLCTEPTFSDSGYSSGEVNGTPFCSEIFFEFLIGETGLHYALENTDPKTAMWSAVFASRILSGINPDSDNDKINKHARKHVAVSLAVANASAILKQAAIEKKDELSPQDWLAWIETKSFIVYPPCRRLIEHWGNTMAQQTDRPMSGDKSIPPQFDRIRISANRVLVAAAWYLECINKRAAILDEVIQQAGMWFSDKDEPDYIGDDLQQITEINCNKCSIQWKTKSGKSRTSDGETLGKTLERWNKGRK